MPHFWSGSYIDAGQRQVCWAHLLLDFTRIAQRQSVPGRIEQRPLGLRLVMFRRRARGVSSAARLKPLLCRVMQALHASVAQNTCRRRAKNCTNLIKLWPALCGVITHSGVEPTKNAAEQALRAIALKRKISGPTRSRRGDDFIASGFNAFETCRRQGRDFLGYLHGAVTAWIDKTAHLSLLPPPVPPG